MNRVSYALTNAKKALIVQDVAAYKALGILAFGGNPQFEEYKETVLAMHPTMTGK